MIATSKDHMSSLGAQDGHRLADRLEATGRLWPDAINHADVLAEISHLQAGAFKFTELNGLDIAEAVEAASAYNEGLANALRERLAMAPAGSVY